MTESITSRDSSSLDNAPLTIGFFFDINFADIYSNPTYGTGDPSYMMNTALFSQATIGSPTSTGATV